MKYKKKPVVVEAYKTDKELDIETLEGTMHASVGDYIITGVNGEKYPCKPDIFWKTYELADKPTIEPSQWISVKERLPNPEEEVEVAYVRKHWEDGHEMHLTCRGMYEDGKIATEDSNYVWDDTFGFDYDEDIDDYLIPEGWYECLSFSETFSAIDMRVTHWMPLPEPPKEDA